MRRLLLASVVLLALTSFALAASPETSFTLKFVWPSDSPSWLKDYAEYSIDDVTALQENAQGQFEVVYRGYYAPGLESWTVDLPRSRSPDFKRTVGPNTPTELSLPKKAKIKLWVGVSTGDDRHTFVYSPETLENLAFPNKFKEKTDAQGFFKIKNPKGTFPIYDPQRYSNYIRLGWVYLYPSPPKILAEALPVIYDAAAYDKLASRASSVSERTPEAVEKEILGRLKVTFAPGTRPKYTAQNVFYHTTRPFDYLPVGINSPFWDGTIDGSTPVAGGEYKISLKIYDKPKDTRPAYTFSSDPIKVRREIDVKYPAQYKFSTGDSLSLNRYTFTFKEVTSSLIRLTIKNRQGNYIRTLNSEPRQLATPPNLEQGQTPQEHVIVLSLKETPVYSFSETLKGQYATETSAFSFALSHPNRKDVNENDVVFTILPTKSAITLPPGFRPTPSLVEGVRFARCPSKQETSICVYGLVSKPAWLKAEVRATRASLAGSTLLYLEGPQRFERTSSTSVPLLRIKLANFESDLKNFGSKDQVQYEVTLRVKESKDRSELFNPPKELDVLLTGSVSISASKPEEAKREDQRQQPPTRTSGGLFVNPCDEPNSRRLCVSHDQRVELIGEIKVATGGVRVFTHPNYRLSREGRQLAFTPTPGKVYTVEFTGKELGRPESSTYILYGSGKVEVQPVAQPARKPAVTTTPSPPQRSTGLQTTCEGIPQEEDDVRIYQVGKILGQAPDYRALGYKVEARPILYTAYNATVGTCKPECGLGEWSTSGGKISCGQGQVCCVKATAGLQSRYVFNTYTESSLGTGGVYNLRSSCLGLRQDQCDRDQKFGLGYCEWKETRCLARDAALSQLGSVLIKRRMDVYCASHADCNVPNFYYYLDGRERVISNPCQIAYTPVCDFRFTIPSYVQS